MHDVVIIGGGPGGLHAAAKLARDGFDVAVLEEHAEIGQPPHCTGILGDEVFEELGLPRDAVLNPLPAVRFHSPGGLELSWTPDRLEAVVVDRVRFDGMLATRAVAAGAALIRGARATGLVNGEHSVEVGIEGQAPVVGRAVVLACGVNYSFQRQLGMGLPSVYLSSAQMEVPAGRSGEVEVYFGLDVAPQGFAWAVPTVRPDGPHVRIGLMCDGDAAGPFRRLMERIGPSWGVAGTIAASPRRRLLPLGAIRRTYADRVVAIGDAAGLVKPTTGGGIYYSMTTGAMAAEVLRDALHRDRLDASALSVYEAGWRKELIPEFRTQLALRMLAQKLSDGEMDALFRLANTNGIMPIVRQTARFNRHRDLILALFRHQPARTLLFRRMLS